MFTTKPRKVTLTLLLFVVVLAIAGLCEANDIGSIPQRRDHALVNRMIKKRILGLPNSSDTDSNGGTNGASSDPPTFDQPAADPSPSPSPSPSSTSVSSQSSSASQQSTSSQESSSGQGSSTSDTSTESSTSASSAPASSNSATSNTSSGSSTQSTSSSAPPTSSTSASNAPAAASNTPTPTPSVPQFTQGSTPTVPDASNQQQGANQVTSTVTMPPSSNTSAAAATGASSSSHITRTTLTVIIAIAASVAAIAIGWTVIRKWKLKPSSSFDDRMQPIDWQPTTADDSGLPNHRRAGSGGSFHSGSGHGDAGIGAYGSDHGHGAAGALAPIPDHDFTAGISTLAPVGGYADLTRGPSPGPQMQEALTRGPSLTRPNYDAYGVPLHHQGGYDAYDYNNTGAVRY